MYLPSLTDDELLAYLRTLDLSQIETELVKRFDAFESREIADPKDEADQLRVDLADAQAEIEKLKAELHKAEQKIESLEEEIADIWPLA